jgi:uncharacterized membrane protein HdeD (DUF308 family)
MSNLSDIARAPSRLGTGWGFAVMLLGILAMMAPFISGVAVTSLVAVFITAAGLAMTVYAFKAGSFGKGLLQFLFGGITVLCGIAMFVTPILSMFGLTGLLMAYFVVDGLFAIISGVRGRPQPGWGWVIVSGIASIVLAVLLWRQWPASGAYAVGLLVGIRLIFTGWSIAMLGMLGDATVDVVEQAVEEAAAEAGQATRST